MDKTWLVKLSAALDQFNGVYSEVDPFVMENSMRILALMAAGVLGVLIVLIAAIVRFMGRRSRRVMHGGDVTV